MYKYILEIQIVTNAWKDYAMLCVLHMHQVNNIVGMKGARLVIEWKVNASSIS